MKIQKFLPIIIFFFTVLFFLRPLFLQNKLPIPADTIVGLYHPFRDLYAKTYPNGIPFKNSLITDPVRQQYPWRYLAISLEKQILFPLWNPYNLSGTPLLAGIQAAPFNPFNLLFFLIPFPYAWSVLIILQPVLAGLFMFLYLRYWKINKIASLTGAVVYAFCGFSVAWMEWGTIVQVALWLPLILLAKERLLKKISWQWVLVLIFAECSQVFAGHLQTLFYSAIISNTYLIIRILQNAFQNNQGKNVWLTAVKMYLPFLYIGISIWVITLVQWLPTVQFILQSARGIDLDWHKPGWFIPSRHLIQFIAPDFFGNPATLNYWGIWNYGEFIGYIGIAPLILAFYAMFFRRDKKTLFFGTFFFLSLLFSLPSWISRIPYVLNIPLLSTAQPTRLLFITDFSLAVLTALGMDNLLKVKNKKFILIPIIFIGIIFLALWLFVLFGFKYIPSVSTENILTAKRNLYLPSILYMAILIISFLYIFPLLLGEGRVRSTIFKILPLLFVLLTVIDLYRFSDKFLSFSDPKYLFPATAGLSYLQRQPGQFRIMTTDAQILPPNFSAMYHLQSIDGYDPLYLLRYGELIAAMERSSPDIHTPFGFNRIIDPHNYNSRIADLLGVKYVLSLTQLTSPKLTKVFSEGQTNIYQNEMAFPRAFFVQKIFPVSNKQESINDLFARNIDLNRDAVIENWDNAQGNDFVPGELSLTNYGANHIEIKTTNSRSGFLVLTDSYYPTWHAKICSNELTDCRETKIYLTDYNFRGIIVPAGQHTVVFQDSLL